MILFFLNDEWLGVWLGSRGFEKTSDESFCQKTVDEAQKDREKLGVQGSKRGKTTGWQNKIGFPEVAMENMDLYDSQFYKICTMIAILKEGSFGSERIQHDGSFCAS